MNGERKAVLFTVGLIVFCLTIMTVLIFASLWPDRQLVAWLLLAFFGSLALALVFVPAASKVNEMAIRHKRYRHHEETPLDQDGHPIYIPPGSQPYRTAQPREIYDYER